MNPASNLPDPFDPQGLNAYSFAGNDPASPDQIDNSDAWTYGEVGTWVDAPGYPAPSWLGDAKASIGAACARNGGGCHWVDPSGSTNPVVRAAWNKIENASGTDRSGGGNFMCVNTQDCKVEHLCYKCIDGVKRLVSRPQPLSPSGIVDIGQHKLYFYKDPLKDWCNAKDFKKGGCHCRCQK